MPVFSVEDARAYHCGQVLRMLRGDHKEALISLGLPAHRHIRACFDDSAFRRVWLMDGRLAGLGGVTGPLMASDGYIWLALSQEVTHYPVAIMREARKQIQEIMQVKRSLITSVIKADTASIRFAERLGFVSEGDLGDWGISMRYTPWHS